MDNHLCVEIFRWWGISVWRLPIGHQNGLRAFRLQLSPLLHRSLYPRVTLSPSFFTKRGVLLRTWNSKEPCTFMRRSTPGMYVCVCVCVCCFVLFGQMCRCGVFITFALCAQSQRRLCIPRSWKGIIGRKVKTWRRKQKLCSKKEIQQVQMPHQMLGGLCWYVAEQRNTAVELKLSFSKPKPLRTHHQWSCCSCLASGNFDMQQTHLGCVLCIIQCNFTSCVLLKTCRNLHNKCSWGHGGSGCLAHPAIWSRPCEKSYCYPMNRKKALLLPDIVLVKMAIRFTRFTIKGLQSRSEAASLGINGYKVSIPWRTRRAHTHKHWDK
jgi:hypothetical protein